jgi:hypothetical protein
MAKYVVGFAVEARAYVEVEADTLEEAKDRAEYLYPNAEVEVLDHKYLYTQDINGNFIEEA